MFHETRWKLQDFLYPNLGSQRVSYSIDQSSYRQAQIQEHERIDSTLKGGMIAHTQEEQIDGGRAILQPLVTIPFK